MGAVTVRAATASLNLSYQLVIGEGSAVAVDEVVNLRSTKTSLAGIRRWFECPGCNPTGVARRKRMWFRGVEAGPHDGCGVTRCPPVMGPATCHRPRLGHDCAGALARSARITPIIGRRCEIS